jgi:Winged helix DNA-binding domain
MASPRIDLTRDQILAQRRRVAALDERLPTGAAALRVAAHAGLQDSMPRAALLSIHARMAATPPDVLDDPELVQVWGPRYSAFVVSIRDVPIFTLGRLPDEPKARQFAEETADRLERFLDGRTMTYGEAGRGLGVHPNMLRYAAPTGRVLIRWEGAAQPTIRAIPRSNLDPALARLELARRYLHVFGPATADSFRNWAGIRPEAARAAFDALAAELTPARTPIGDGWILADDEPGYRATASAPAPARLLPSGDTFYQLQEPDRALLVPDAARRARLWTSRVWPGALLLAGDVAGTWRRSEANLAVEPWRDLTAGERDAVEAEAASLPLPGLPRAIQVRWEPAV